MPCGLLLTVAVFSEPAVGSIRLSFGSTGSMAIYKNHKWGALCADGFDTTDSVVVCRQLGLYGGTVIPLHHFMIAENTSDTLVWSTSLNCNGTEDSLLKCSGQWIDNYLGYNSSECTSGAYAAVRCSVNELTTDEQNTTDAETTSDCDSNGNCDTNTMDSTSDYTYENSSIGGLTEQYSVNPQLNFVLERAPIRLMGNTPYTGIIELYVDNAWTSICDSYWNDNDATVVCRQLGFRGGNAMGEFNVNSLFLTSKYVFSLQNSIHQIIIPFLIKTRVLHRLGRITTYIPSCRKL